MSKKFGWGGKRPGAGRPKSPNSGVPHLTRPDFDKPTKFKVICRSRAENGDLRNERAYEVITSIFRDHYDHHGLHVLGVEVDEHALELDVLADDRSALIRGIQGLQVRVARRCNIALGLRGKFWKDRYEVEKRL